jgi:hypothetical protein
MPDPTHFAVVSLDTGAVCHPQPDDNGKSLSAAARAFTPGRIAGRGTTREGAIDDAKRERVRLLTLQRLAGEM